MNTENNQEPAIFYQKTPTSELNELIAVIVDYYCFKNNITDEEEGEEWKKKTGNVKENIVPEKLDGLIEKAFSSQLKRYISKD